MLFAFRSDQIRLHLFQPHQADQMFDPPVCWVRVLKSLPPTLSPCFPPTIPHMRCDRHLFSPRSALRMPRFVIALSTKISAGLIHQDVTDGLCTTGLCACKIECCLTLLQITIPGVPFVRIVLAKQPQSLLPQQVCTTAHEHTQTCYEHSHAPVPDAGCTCHRIPLLPSSRHPQAHLTHHQSCLHPHLLPAL